VIFVNGL